METAQKIGTSLYLAGSSLLQTDRSEPTMGRAAIRFVGLHLVTLGPPIVNALIS
ncbi:hypothetical protein [Histidinibacterium aquaticum]|uniref:hypothetical protein n=1 Tax=Histidinibacterium aquaticum TaxID=2613962 RepID=UPI00168A5873|nr:hypothetical protein [Histidinibacterium aquaticum]